jgi:hypothetical protein
MALCVCVCPRIESGRGGERWGGRVTVYMAQRYPSLCVQYRLIVSQPAVVPECFPIVGIGFPTSSLMCLPPWTQRGGNTLLGGGGGRGKANSDDWIESLALYILCETSQRGQYILFSVVFTPPPLSHHGSIWLLPVISLLLTNTVFPVRACLSI